ncbi:MAG: glutathione S-transferase family protein [Alphaproteobacteria bacterium]|nr:glutathione S-transferase family protein [Alphaproteobacteria bacterium]
MRILYHYWESPFCRKVRMALSEKGFEFQLELEKTWERREGFLVFSPSGEVPVLVEPNGRIISDHNALCEYLDEIQPTPTLFGDEPVERAEVRRLVGWFDGKFKREVGDNLAGEKLTKRIRHSGAPNSLAIRAGGINIRNHLEYVNWLMERRSWLAGKHFSLADIAAAAHFSVVDYIGDVPWDDYPEARLWYSRIKSRPSFRPILEDKIPGIAPVEHYSDPDF